MAAQPLGFPVQVKQSMSVSKALLLIDAFLEGGHTLGVTELAQRTGLPKSTAFRILAQLTASGFVVRNGNSYRLSVRMFELGNRYIHCRPEGLKDIASPLLGDLFLQSGYMSTLAVLDDTDVVILDRLRSSRGPLSPTVVGGRRPALATDLGKAMAAFSDSDLQDRIINANTHRFTPHTITHAGRLKQQLLQIRETSIAYDLEESIVGMAGVAAPVLVNNRAIAAVSVSGPANRVNLEELAPKVLRTARLIANNFIRAREMAHDYEPDQTRWGFDPDAEK